MMALLRSLVSNLPLKITALVIAAVLWFIAVLDRTYTLTLKVPVTVGRSETRTLVYEVDTKSAAVVVQGRGRDLVNLRPHRLRFTVPAPEARLGRKPVKLTAAELRLPANVTLLSADPEYVELRVGQATSRSVAVEVPLSGTAPNSMMVTVNRPPAMVRLIGAEDAIRGVSSISTETLDLGTVSQPGTRRLRVVVPANAFFFSEPESVDVSVVLQKEGARIFIDVPVSSIAPTGRTVELDPATAQIAVAGPADRIDSLRLADITAQVRISGLGPGEYRLAAEIVLPPEFRLVKCEPQLFDVTVK